MRSLLLIPFMVSAVIAADPVGTLTGGAVGSAAGLLGAVNGVNVGGLNAADLVNTAQGVAGGLPVVGGLVPQIPLGFILTILPLLLTILSLLASIPGALPLVLAVLQLLPPGLLNIGGLPLGTLLQTVGSLSGVAGAL
ncbi:hypothetical protein QR680_016316 [Steinernema hermaphroditum]|uniref:Uncharacterized protein n=1 Tax=Steinernema hermaphroditum TaxID=289476 RepID=A0AA39HCS5_9BILA|nr:hypothetical protein QR680_016316 [Steinernema hermaphroditum]